MGMGKQDVTAHTQNLRNTILMLVGKALLKNGRLV